MRARSSPPNARRDRTHWTRASKPSSARDSLRRQGAASCGSRNRSRGDPESAELSRSRGSSSSRRCRRSSAGASSATSAAQQRQRLRGAGIGLGGRTSSSSTRSAVITRSRLQAAAKSTRRPGRGSGSGADQSVQPPGARSTDAYASPSGRVSSSSAKAWSFRPAKATRTAPNVACGSSSTQRTHVLGVSSVRIFARSPPLTRAVAVQASSIVCSVNQHAVRATRSDASCSPGGALHSCWAAPTAGGALGDRCVSDRRSDATESRSEASVSWRRQR